MNKSESIAKLSEALAKAQGSIQNAKKDADNPFFKSRYADLASVWDVCRRPFADNGLSIIQIQEAIEGKMRLTTVLAHSSGEWISGDLDMTPVKTDPQGIGSCITYARRYALSAFAGVATEDDDGNAASGKDAKQAPQEARTFTAKPKPDAVLTAPLAAAVAKAAEQRGMASEPKDSDPYRMMTSEEKIHLHKYAEGLGLSRKDFKSWLATQSYVTPEGEGSTSVIAARDMQKIKLAVKAFVEGRNIP